MPNSVNSQCNGSRRELLRTGLGAFASLSLPTLMRLRAEAPAVITGTESTAIIVVWLRGGASIARAHIARIALTIRVAVRLKVVGDCGAVVLRGVAVARHITVKVRIGRAEHESLAGAYEIPVGILIVVHL